MERIKYFKFREIFKILPETALKIFREIFFSGKDFLKPYNADRTDASEPK